MEQQQQLHQLPPMDHNENQQYFYKRKYDADDEDDDNKLLDKENAHDNYIKIYNGDNSKNKIKNNYNNVDHDDDDYDDHNVHIEVETKNCSDKFLENNTNISTRPCLDGNQQNQALFSTFNYQNESSLEPVNKIRNNVEREDDQDTIDDGDVVDDEDEADQEKDDSNDIEETPKFIRDEYTNVERHNKGKPLSDGDVTVQKIEQKSGKDGGSNNPNRDTEISGAQSLTPLSSYVQTQTIATTHVQNVSQHLDHPHPLVDPNNLGQQISHGLHKSLHHLLEATGVKCVDSMGTLCDMEAFSKIDCKDTQSNQDYGPKKYYHPLYAHGVCRWPGCELPLEDMATFVNLASFVKLNKHLKTEHCLDDRSTAQARVQMQVVSQLEMHLQKERDRLQAMMHHLYLTKHFAISSEDAHDSNAHIHYKNALRTGTTTPDKNNNNNNNNNEDSDDGSDLQSMGSTLMNSSNMSSTRKRICDKSPLALAGGLPYMLERAGLDVQQEIQRNREFYKNADVRPPFTYASLIRQSIIESPDKQLTLNEIYNWFQNTFCYFRRNAATWKNAIRTNLSLHKCFVRYEDDFGSFWMVDDSEFVKRRHLSRGRPRKYEPSSSPNSNSQQFGNSLASTASSDVVDSGSVGNDINVSPGSSTAGSSRLGGVSSNGSLFNRSGNKSNCSDHNGGNDDYDICEVSQRSPAGCQTHKHNSGSNKQYFSTKRQHHQGSIMGHSRIINRSNVGAGGVVSTAHNPGVSGIGDYGPVGSLDVDNNGPLHVSTAGVETEDTNGFDFHSQSISNDGISNSSVNGKHNNGRYSPIMQNMWSFGSPLSDEAASAEFSRLNSDRYRNFVTGLHLQSLTQHHFHQHQATNERLLPKSQQQQNPLRNNISSQQHDVRSLHQAHGYHIYHSTHDEHQQKILQDQPLNQDIFAVNAILSNSDKYISHNLECRNGSDPYNQRQQQTLNHRLNNNNPHSAATRSELMSNEEISNQIYVSHLNDSDIDVKFTPSHKAMLSMETQGRSDINPNKRSSAGMAYNPNKSSERPERDSGNFDYDPEQVFRKRKKCNFSSNDFNDVEIKAEVGINSRKELRNSEIPLRIKSY